MNRLVSRWMGRSLSIVGWLYILQNSICMVRCFYTGTYSPPAVSFLPWHALPLGGFLNLVTPTRLPLGSLRQVHINIHPVMFLQLTFGGYKLRNASKQDYGTNIIVQYLKNRNN